jgi:site-specific recombinase XerD
MSALAPTLQAFFSERLMNQREASAHTVEAYRDSFRLLLAFACRRTAKAPSALDFEDLDAALIGAFLEHLERERGNSARTRNCRLAAIHSLFRFAAFSHPEHADLIQRVLAIPTKRCKRSDVAFLEGDEIEALLAAPQRSRWIGRRDHALLVTAVQTGLRVSELTGLRCADVRLDRGAHVRCLGKGRKQRCTPLTTNTAAVLRVWLQERGGGPREPLFPTSRGRPLSRDAVALLVSKYAKVAAERCPTLKSKSVSPHVLRHSAAMTLLRAGVDATVLALWLGHESVETTQVYIHADLTIKERALARTAPLDAVPGRYRPPDALLAFLEGL